jgi:hypothetical protein
MIPEFFTKAMLELFFFGSLSCLRMMCLLLIMAGYKNRPDAYD